MTALLGLGSGRCGVGLFLHWGWTFMSKGGYEEVE